jgi:DNA adenine methylase
MVERLDWSECIGRYDRPHTLFFMDPPYFETEGYGGHFALEQYALLAETMRSMRGKAVLTINDVEPMREAFRGFVTRRVSIKYSVGRAKAARNSRGELIVLNWKP